MVLSERRLGYYTRGRRDGEVAEWLKALAC
jgi:hypothetical protein